LSETVPDVEAARYRLLNLYAAVTLLMLAGIAILVVYILVGVRSLTSPGAEQSFGLAVSLMALMGAVIGHVIDRTYRVWPLGRRITPTPPGFVSTRAQSNFVRVLIVLAAAGAVAYLIAGLLT